MKQSADSKFKGENGPRRKPIESLETYLQVYIERMNFHRLEATRFRRFEAYEMLTMPPLVIGGRSIFSAPYLRRHLLTLKSPSDFDMGRFSELERFQHETLGTVDPETVEAWKSLVHIDLQFPVFLAQWMTTSRRVYELSEEQELALSAMDLKDIRWEDISFPFESFAVSLPVPIKMEGNRECAFVLFNRDRGGGLTVTLIPKVAGSFKPTAQSHIEVAVRNIQAGNPEVELSRELQRKVSGIYADYATIVSKDTSRIIETHSQAADINLAFRLVAGLCLYLRTAAAEKPGIKSDWVSLGSKKGGTLDTKAVTDEAQVCTVASQLKLSPELRNAIKRRYILREEIEMPAGFVEGHWRRLPGRGNDPDAPKVVEVHPYAKGMDRLPQDALVGGSEKRID